ncbi:MAG: AAA family ATPase [Fimbriimonadaceae bacterium]|nr:AAA family ATPase [Fimbriimonadaceae bacterium]
MSEKIRFAPAARSISHVKIAVAGVSGSGKTTAAIKLALGMGGRCCVIDTEGGASNLLADLGQFDVAVLEPPFTVGKILEAVEEAIREEYATVVIDSLSPVWTQLLTEKAALDARPGSNGFSNWKPISSEYDSLVNGLMRAPINVVATLRSKTAYVQVVEAGRTTIKRLAEQPIMRDGFEFECTTVLELDRDTHIVSATKDRTNLFSDWRKPLDEEAGKLLESWLKGAATGMTNKRLCVEGQWLREIITAEEMEEFKRICSEGGTDWKRAARAAMKAGACDFQTLKEHAQSARPDSAQGQ